MQLGRQYHDAAKLAAVPPHVVDGPPPPRLDRSHIPFTPGLWRNDVAPDCTAVALANSARAVAWLDNRTDILVNQDGVLGFYAACAGCKNDLVSICATDGAEILDVLGRASHGGFDVGQQVPMVPTWAQCPTADRISIAHAALTGAVLLGVDLALCDRAAEFWDTGLPASAGDQTPGSWGGHALILWDYDGLGDTDTVRLGTWGAWQRATWRWVLDRLEDQEAYAVHWRQFGDQA